MVYGVCTLAVLIDSCYQQSLSEVGVSLRRPYPKLLNLFLYLFFLTLSEYIGDFAIFQNYESLRWQQVEVMI